MSVSLLKYSVKHFVRLIDFGMAMRTDEREVTSRHDTTDTTCVDFKLESLVKDPRLTICCCLRYISSGAASAARFALIEFLAFGFDHPVFKRCFCP